MLIMYRLRERILAFILVAAFSAAHAAFDLPRFASLRSDNINTRVGPGMQYPVEWTYVRARLPVKIVKEFDHWRLIEDAEGQQSWVHQRLLSGLRTVLFVGRTRITLLKQPNRNAQSLADIEPGVVAVLDKSEKDWIRVKINNVVGWVHQDQVWGIKL